MDNLLLLTKMAEEILNEDYETQFYGFAPSSLVKASMFKLKLVILLSFKIIIV